MAFHAMALEEGLNSVGGSARRGATQEDEQSDPVGELWTPAKPIGDFDGKSRNSRA